MILSLPISSVASAARRHRACRRAVAMAGIFAATLPFSAAGVGLGEITQQSSLGRSLRIVVPVTLGADEELATECFKLTGAERDGDGVPQLLFGRVNVERTAAGTRLVVTSGRPVNDPIVRITLQAGCESPVRREYTLFMDPPAIEVPVVAAEAAPPEPVVAAAPPPASRETGRSARSQAGAPARAAPRSATAPTSGSGTEPARKAAPPKGRAVTKAAPARPPATASERPRFSVSSGAPGTLGGSAAAEADREKARQERANAIEAETQVLRQRIVELTAMVERMQQELRAQETAEQAAAEAAKSAAATPVAAAGAAAPPPKSAKAEPPAAAKAPPPAPVTDWWDDSAPLVAAIIALGLVTAAAVLWKRRRDAAQDDQWRTAEAAPIRTGPRTESPTSVLRNPSAGINLTHPETVAPADAKEVGITSTRDAADALAVSDLSHVTEEARVFMALGHNDRAIEVLHDHTRRLPRSTPAAWLMLLDLLHATGKRPEFGKLAEEFHAHFNVQAPLWDTFASDRSATDGIEGFPHVERLVVELWRKPGCRAYLERLLCDNREGRRNGFPLSAYADILLLLQVLDAPAEIDIDGDLAAAGKFGLRPSATRAAAGATAARARKPMPPASHPTQQPIRFEIEPPDTGSKS